MRYSIDYKKYLTEGELETLNAILEKDQSRNGILLKTAMHTGARAQEVLNIRGEDLNDQHHSVIIYGLKGSDNREIPLPKELFFSLKRLVVEPNQKVFNIAYRTMVDIWHKYRPVKKKLHALRHTFAIETYKRTNDIELIKAALGHRSLMNTSVYTEHIYKSELLKKLVNE